MKTKLRHIADVKIYDNGGKTADRLTMAFPFDRNERNRLVAMVSLSFAPFHPQGVCQHGEGMLGRHLGKRISYVDLNDDCAKVLKQELAAYNADTLLQIAKKKIEAGEDVTEKEKREIVQLAKFAGVASGYPDDVEKCFAEMAK
jgi:hypothetical protein